jgi:hypothetical protein
VLPPPCQPVSNLLGNAAIPVELWAMVFVGALRVVGGSDVIARIVWRSGEAPARR